MGNSIRLVLSRCFSSPLTLRKSSMLGWGGEEGGREEGKGRRDLGMGSLSGRKVSKPLAVVQGSCLALARVWRLRAVRSIPIVNAGILLT